MLFRSRLSRAAFLFLRLLVHPGLLQRFTIYRYKLILNRAGLVKKGCILKNSHTFAANKKLEWQKI